jgi:hypothetical protein
MLQHTWWIDGSALYGFHDLSFLTCKAAAAAAAAL